MALYQQKEATLGPIEGRGYAFLQLGTYEKTYRGVFFSAEERAADLKALIEEDEVEFTGVVYSKNRSGKVTKKIRTFMVDVEKMVSVHIGERADFNVVTEI